MFRWHIDRQVAGTLAMLAAFSAVMLFLMLVFLLMEAWPVLAEGGWRAFFSHDSWYPLEGQFGLTPMIWASIAITVGAIMLAVPLGVACAVFIHFYSPKLMLKGFRLVLSLMAGIPSVVYGLWGLTELVPLIAELQPPGASMLAAILVLTLMILPTVAVTSAAALAGIPKDILAGGAALGFSDRRTIISLALPAARTGIWGGVLLAMARALGETMAVLMVAGNVVQNPSGLFEPVRALTANIALEMAYATDTHRAGLFTSGLLLTLLVLILAWLAARMTVEPAND